MTIEIKSIKDCGLPKVDGEYFARRKNNKRWVVTYFTKRYNETVTPETCCYDYYAELPAEL